MLSEADKSLKRQMLILYIAYIGVLTMGSFIFLIVAYFMRRKMKETILESHINWFITTVWQVLAFTFLAQFLMSSFVPNDASVESLVSSNSFSMMILAMFLMLLYSGVRCAQGILRLSNNEPME
ncbi:hypothetical protein [Basilea psittacipulmonis]|uniref:Uncharacterized protein n=1 Tax=Basilea psittacipulmonis DSM 24701 TaxID=1072685 RepID=A0A077DBM4_9BURK|nr:hypothetical protein [Basilea psittacipulmonis]AIL32069.1 hypothetical protein IX83_00855 [Basilea psittacipulmonis DSM 24701]